MSTPRRSILLAFSERYATLLIYFVSTVILARLLTPAELGVYSVGMAVVTMAHSLRDFGISNFLIQKERLTQEDVFTVCWISVALAWGIGLVILAASGEVAAFYGQPQLRLLIIILAGSFFVLPFSSLRMALLRREMAFGALMRINVGAALVQASLSIVLVACGLSYLGLGLAALMGTVATLLAASRVPVRFRLFGLRFGDWRPVWYFSSRATSMSLIGNLGSASPDLLIGKLVGFDAVGLFSRAMGLVQLVERGIMDGVRGVALPYFAGCHRRDESLGDVYSRSLTLLLSVSWPALALLAMTAVPTVRLLFGEQWGAAAPLAAILVVGAAARNIGSLLSSVLLGGGHIDVLPLRSLIWELTKVILMLAGMPWGLAGIAVGYATAEIIGAGLFMQAARHRLKIGLEEQRKILGRAFLLVSCTGSAGFLASFLTRDSGSVLLELLAVSLASVSAWLIYVRATRHPIWSEVCVLASSATPTKFRC